jgi:hypothetical protein
MSEDNMVNDIFFLNSNKIKVNIDAVVQNNDLRITIKLKNVSKKSIYFTDFYFSKDIWFYFLDDKDDKGAYYTNKHVSYDINIRKNSVIELKPEESQEYIVNYNVEYTDRKYIISNSYYDLIFNNPQKIKLIIQYNLLKSEKWKIWRFVKGAEQMKNFSKSYDIFCSYGNEKVPDANFSGL